MATVKHGDLSSVGPHDVVRFVDAAERTAQMPSPALNQLSMLDSAPGVVDAWNGTDWTAIGAGTGGGGGSSVKYTTTIGGSTLSTVTHNLGTKDVIVELYEVATGQTVYADVTRTTTSAFTVGFTTAPAAAAIAVVVLA